MKLEIVNEINENKSRFLTYIVKNFYNAKKVEEIYLYLKKKHKKAKHICWAYSLKEGNIIIKKYSDDGEPKGTAGIPILSVIDGKNKENILILVVRYYGGKKLGASKLLRTYRRSAREALEL